MIRPELWVKSLSRHAGDATDVLLCWEEAQSLHREIASHEHCPLRSFFCTVECPPLPSVSFGQEVEGEAGSTRKAPLGSDGRSTCEISLWPREGLRPSDESAILEECNEALLDLLAKLWRPELRDEKSRLLSLHLSQVTALLSKTVQGHLAGGKHVAVLYIDLDRFKEVNDKYGQSIGDKLIQHFASILAEAVEESGIPIHVGGDEFSVLLPVDHYDQALRLAHMTAQLAGQKAFGLPPDRRKRIELSVAMGIAVAEPNAGLPQYQELLTRAETAVKPGDGTKIRGTARFADSSDSRTTSPAGEFARNTAVCLVRSSLTNQRPFGSPWLNLISQLACDSTGPSGASPLPSVGVGLELWGWLRPEWDNESVMACYTGLYEGWLAPRFGAFDAAIAVAHGTLKAYSTRLRGASESMRIDLRHSTDWASVSVVLDGGEELAVAGDSEAERSEVFPFGESWRIEGEPHPSSTAIACLVKIGHSVLHVPEGIFAGVITIDDRPTRGGGLPDFSHAAIARLIASLEVNPNISVVYVLGDHQYARRTVQALRDIGEWPDAAEHIASKTGIGTPSIRNASARVRDAVYFHGNEEGLVAQMAERMRAACVLKPILTPEPIQAAFLARELVTTGLSLAKEDGCRVQTAADAYPTVLEIVRRAEGIPAITDQGGLTLREKVYLKVTQEDPTRAKVPAFYQDEVCELESYFERVFLDEDSLFGRTLNATGQIEGVLSHLVGIINEPSRRFATRRAILVVPHEVTGGNDITPLGLVSVRILPRFKSDDVVLSFSFTWRTVEVLVGFPYSLYGSIRFSEYLADTIQSRVKAEFSGHIGMGQLSYMAHSLHMFVDEYGQSIARKIVNEASI